MYPSEYLLKLWKGISYPVKVTFASSVAIGIVVHMFFITNMLVNHDSINVIMSFHFLISQGRWFAIVPWFLSTNYILPWNTGLLIILYSAVSSCLVIKCFRVNNGLHCVLISGLMVSFPTVVCTLTYHADFLIAALLLASLGVYIAQRFRYGFCVGFIFISMSLGLYQSYFSVAAALSVGILIIDIIQANLSLKELLLKGIKLFFTLLLGIIAYFIIVKLSLAMTQRQLSAYQGISEMGKISISTIPHQIKQAYVSIFDFFIRDNYNLHGSVLKYLFFVIIIISIIILLVIIVQKKIYKRKSHFFILLLLVILYPLACNIVYLMNAAIMYLNMIYGMVFLPISCIALMELIKSKVSHKEMSFIFSLKRMACWVLSVFFAICIWNYGLLANKTYTKMHIVYEQAYAYSVELITRIESTDGYSDDIPIILCGTPGRTINLISAFDELKGIYGAVDNIAERHSYIRFLRNFLGFRTGAVLAGGRWGDPDIITKYNLEQQLIDMPSYPNVGSIKRINDVIAVKFSSIAEARVIAELPIPKDIEELQQNMYDIVSVGIINDNVVLECGTYDPQLYLSMQNPIGKYAGRPFVEITYTSSNAGLVQVFYDYGNGLSEEMSSRQTIEPVGEETTIRLPIVGWGEGKQLIGFRIDPPNGTRFVLINVKLLSSD